MTGATNDGDNNNENNDARQRLKEVEEEIARLRGDHQQLGEGLSDGAGPTDAEEAAAANTNMQETEALLGVLEQRRARLLEQLGEG